MRLIKSTTPILLEVLRKSIPPNLNIFHHIYLNADSPLLITNQIHPQTKYEVGVKFKIQGDIKGEVYFFLDTYSHELNQVQHLEIEQMLTECANIFLGNTLGSLDKYNYLALLSSPTILNNSAPKSNKNLDLFSINYKVIFNLQEYHLRILFNLKEVK